MTENKTTEELTEEEFLELVLDEQEKALAKERERRLNPIPKKPKRQNPVVRVVVWLMALTLIFNTFAVIFNVYSIPAIEFLKVSAKLSNQEDVQLYKKAVVTINTDSGKGTGFAVSEDGYIITNEHVINNALTITVVFPDDTLYKAQIIESYEDYDLALLKIEATDIPYLKLADSSSFKQNEHVYFIGNPLAFSGIANEGEILGYTNAIGVTPDIIMMNAPVYRGNSGSPVINEAGEVIGVVFATGSRDNYGKVGLFIPIENVHSQFNLLQQKSSTSKRGE
ncbi:S1C family serine protease [Solibacillus daqui]|uniref:S1C family serine protease n=1 Tax=Solibacillus daqui TaxID=2912187 RepID=UPI002366CE67|nr:serine protease [Solibacillus daqui]